MEMAAISIMIIIQQKKICSFVQVCTLMYTGVLYGVLSAQ